jgi:hypothetical protein
LLLDRSAPPCDTNLEIDIGAGPNIAVQTPRSRPGENYTRVFSQGAVELAKK